jgi:hypothetical protein
MQYRMRSDHVQRAIDLHHAQRAFLVEDRAHQRRHADYFGSHGVARRMVVTGVVGVVLER